MPTPEEQQDLAHALVISKDWVTSDGRSANVRFGPDRNTSGLKACSAEETVKATYRQVLKREADAFGLEAHVRALSEGTRTVQELVLHLLQSDEWKSRFIEGHRVPEILLALYSCALARTPDRAGWNDFMALGARNDWSSVMDAFVKGSEYTECFGDDTVPGQACRYVRVSSLR